MNKGKIVVLSGPSGAGKTTLHSKVLSSKKFKNKLVKSISATTRKKRAGERHGRDYLFLSEKMFFHKIKAGHFLESEKVFGNYYGTLKSSVEKNLRKGKSVLMCIDVKGARSVSKAYPEAIKIFVRTPSIKILKERLLKRGSENEETLKRRLNRARQELKEAGKFNYIVVNDRLTNSYSKINKILSKELLA